MGEAPLRIEILTDIDGVTFDDCYSRANEQIVDGSPVPVISLNDLKVNKRASGRSKDPDHYPTNTEEQNNLTHLTSSI